VTELLTRDSSGRFPRPSSTGRVLSAKKSSTDPRNHREAMAADKANGDTGWRDAELKELKSQRANESFVVKPSSERPAGRNSVKFTWVYKMKRDGTKKARLCVQGCTQVKGVDYDQTYCGTMRPTSLRVITAIAAARGWNLRRWDFVTAYLQGELQPGEVVYCSLPPGGLGGEWGDVSESSICVVQKPIYGMAQAGRRWQRGLYDWLASEEVGCVRCTADNNVFTLKRTMETPDGPREESLIVGVYVDDLQLAYGPDDEHSLYTWFTKQLQERWKVDDEGDVTDLLGVEFTRDGGEIVLSQRAYIERLVAEYCPDGVPNKVQSNTTPCGDEIMQRVADALADDSVRDIADVRAYQSIVGALLYCATHTRPDVAYAVGMLCRCMSMPSPLMLASAQRVLHYLYRTRHLGLRYTASEKKLFGMSDADWAVKHSTMGYAFMLSEATISWASKKQDSVALSTTEAEIMAASEGAKEAVHLTVLGEELGAHDGSSIDLFCDNKSAIALAYNPEHHQRSKHIQRRHFFIRELVEKMQLNVPFVQSCDNIADFFTKPLNARVFFPMRDILMNVPLSERCASK
jgi:hypothetical protein